jgi:hypothetical protein
MSSNLFWFFYWPFADFVQNGKLIKRELYRDNLYIKYYNAELSAIINTKLMILITRVKLTTLF